MKTERVHRRVVVAGGCRTGKTTLADKWGRDHGVLVRHTDELIHLGWSQASDAAAKWFDEKGPWLIEGVAAVRALRKWAAVHHRDELPCDVLVYLSRPLEPLTPGQQSMNRGVQTIWDQIMPDLARRGVEIKEL